MHYKDYNVEYREFTVNDWLAGIGGILKTYKLIILWFLSPYTGHLFMTTILGGLYFVKNKQG